MFVRGCPDIGVEGFVLVVPLRRVHFLALEIFQTRNARPFHIVEKSSS